MLLAGFASVWRGPAEAQDTTDVLSDKQLRQRINFALQRFDNLYEELEATEQHLNVLLEELNKRVKRDSLRQAFTVDSVEILVDGSPPPDGTIEMEVGDSHSIGAALYKDGEVVGCMGACQGIEPVIYATTPAGTPVVLASRTLQEAPLPVPEVVYRRAYLRAGPDKTVIWLVAGLGLVALVYGLRKSLRSLLT